MCNIISFFKSQRKGRAWGIMKKKSIVFIAIICVIVIIGGIAIAKWQGNTVDTGQQDPQPPKGGQQRADEQQQADDREDKDQLPATGAEAEDEQQGKEEDQNRDLVYISASRLRIRQEPSTDADIVDSLVKGSAVAIIGEKTLENGELWYNIEFNDGKNNVTGWINSEFAVENREDLLDETYKRLDFSPQEKVREYPNNPRVKTKGIYLTIYSAAGSRVDSLIEMAKRTQINTFVIDVKEDKGLVLFPNETAEKYSPKANQQAPLKDIQGLMKKLKDNGIYTIARIVCFKDPTYVGQFPDRAIFDKRTGKPYQGSDRLIWATPHDNNLWEYNINMAKEAAAVGFNEVQFDYVRFPASNGGKLDSVLDYKNTEGISKPETIQNFLKKAYNEISPLEVYISADVYGMVSSVEDDMGIGQYWEAISNVVDYICPMKYPSHYGNGIYGLSVPDAYPYETVYYSTRDSVARNRNIQTPAVVRPWIQDFTATWVKGHIKYGEKEVRDQIRALEENGVTEFLLWNAGNRYTEAAVR
jgi:hypothetical protein